LPSRASDNDTLAEGDTNGDDFGADFQIELKDDITLKAGEFIL
jgi:hypothetical protein